MIEIVRTGPLALLEDAGRPGLAAVGVGPSGAFDRAAFREGALLVGNTQGQAAIEVTLGGLAVCSTGDHRVALTGAACPLSVNGEPVPWRTALALAPGDVLALGLPPRGLRSYLSVAGGLDVAPVLGSRSTDLLSALGPARLARGDLLPVGVVLAQTHEVLATRHAAAGEPARPEALPEPATTAGGHRGPPQEPARVAGERHEVPPPQIVLELLPGPRTDWLANPGALAGGWTVSPDSNRVGVRLSGPVVRRADAFEGAELPSEPLVRGAVQLPPSGQPVIFGPDHPTTGGYPVVGVLTEAASDLLAQCRPGDRIKLRWSAGAR